TATADTRTGLHESSGGKCFGTSPRQPGAIAHLRFILRKAGRPARPCLPGKSGDGQPESDRKEGRGPIREPAARAKGEREVPARPWLALRARRSVLSAHFFRTPLARPAARGYSSNTMSPQSLLMGAQPLAVEVHPPSTNQGWALRGSVGTNGAGGWGHDR